MDNGWICLHRELWKWEWYKTPYMVHLFVHLILSANHENGRWKGIEVKRGQCVTGRKALNKETGISERSIRTCLSRLEDTGEIVQKSTNQYTLVTICNYDRYQNIIFKNDQRPTSDRPATDQRPTTNNNENNENNEKKKNKKEKGDLIKGTIEDVDFSAIPTGISRETIAAFLAHRKAKKACLTQNALELTCKSAVTASEGYEITPDQAIMYAIERNWLTCRPEWLAKDFPARGACVGVGEKKIAVQGQITPRLTGRQVYMNELTNELQKRRRKSGKPETDTRDSGDKPPVPVGPLPGVGNKR